MSCIRPHIGSTQPIFYDLGSGTGKMLMAAALSYPFKKCMNVHYERRWNRNTDLIVRIVAASDAESQRKQLLNLGTDG